MVERERERERERKKKRKGKEGREREWIGSTSPHCIAYVCNKINNEVLFQERERELDKEELGGKIQFHQL